MRTEAGFSDTERGLAARLFWQAFSGKLGKLMAPEDKALAFLSDALDPSHAIVARSEAGELLGIAGIKTARGGLICGTLRDLARVYGWSGALWRGPLLELTSRRLKAGQLLMDGLFVRQDMRGLGVGSALIEAIAGEAANRGLVEIRLDVIDGNEGARKLYERHGFVATSYRRMGPLALLFGFRGETTMCRAVPNLAS